MGRSVDYLTGAEYVFYFEHGTEDSWEWDMLRNSIVEHIRKRLPSYRDCKSWDGRETRIFLENSFCEIGISEYCGLVSVSIRTKDDPGYYMDATGLAQHHILQVRDNLERAVSEAVGGLLEKVGTFSNGKAVFKRKG